jgi:Putative cyclase
VTTVPTEDEVLGYFHSLSNWGRWGPDDELGTINHIGAEQRRRAAALIRDGVPVSCSLDIVTTPPSPPDPNDKYGSPSRFMMRSGEGLADPHPVDRRPRWTGASEYLGLVFHGQSITHLDALSHLFWDRQTFQGHPAEVVSNTRGATRLAIGAMKTGIFTRGVLIDMPLLRGVDWLPPSEPVGPEDLLAAEKRFGVTIGKGDLVLLRTGYGLRKVTEGHLAPHEYPGYHVACLPLFYEREVAVIGADMDNDVRPSGYECATPVHYVSICAMGMPLIDNCDLEALAEQCQRSGRYEFAISVAPLLISGGTGSPVNPIAVF